MTKTINIETEDLSINLRLFDNGHWILDKIIKKVHIPEWPKHVNGLHIIGNGTDRWFHLIGFGKFSAGAINESRPLNTFTLALKNPNRFCGPAEWVIK